MAELRGTARSRDGLLFYCIIIHGIINLDSMFIYSDPSLQLQGVQKTGARLRRLRANEEGMYPHTTSKPEIRRLPQAVGPLSHSLSEVI